MENTAVLNKTHSLDPQLKRPGWRQISWQKVLPWIVPLTLLVAWQAVVSFGWVASSTLPSPLAVIQDGIGLTVDGTLPKNISISLYRATMGLLIGGSIGFLLGFVNGLSTHMRALTDSSIQMLRNIPHLSLIPVVILTLGIGEVAKISLVAVGVMFPVYINTFHGIRSVDPELIEMGRSYGLSRKALFTKIIFPGALPTILMGLRYALGVMWTTLIVAETMAADSGIGYMATNAQNFMDMETILLCIVIYALLGKLSDLIAKNIETLALGWQQQKGGH